MADSLDPNTMLTRAATAAALSDRGFPCTEAGLAARACRGGGPPYRTFGRNALYKWADVLAWLDERMTPAASSAAVHRAARVAAKTGTAL